MLTPGPVHTEPGGFRTGGRASHAQTKSVLQSVLMKVWV